MRTLNSLFALALISTGALATTPEIKDLVGTYEGISAKPEWSQDVKKCTVTISLSRQKEVEVVLRVDGGIPLYTRQPVQSSSYKVTKLPELRFPKVSVKEMKRVGYEEGYMMAKGNYGLRILNLDTSYGMIQVNYTKTNPLSVYDTVLAYTDSLTGCYDIQKVK